FFFSSRRRHTRSLRDWSSDVCSSDLRDLRQRGLLDDTLVVWTSEFGRTPFNNSADAKGREHHPWAFSSWLAGGGVRGGLVYGAKIGRASCRERGESRAGTVRGERRHR